MINLKCVLQITYLQLHNHLEIGQESTVLTINIPTP